MYFAESSSRRPTALHLAGAICWKKRTSYVFNAGFTARRAKKAQPRLWPGFFVLSREAPHKALLLSALGKNTRFAGLEMLKGHPLRGAKEPAARRWETGSQRLGVELRRRKKSRHHPPLYFSSNTPVLLTSGSLASLSGCPFQGPAFRQFVNSCRGAPFACCRF
jgi:hypothetical protein